MTNHENAKQILIENLLNYNPKKSKKEAEFEALQILDKLDYKKLYKFANEYMWQDPPQFPKHMC